MIAHQVRSFWRAPNRICFWLALCCALSATGCGNWRLPRIDPTGERLLVPGNSALPPGAPGAIGQWGITVSPNQVIAPVGSEVVMIATIMGPEGFPLSRERVEWMLAPDGAGEFISPGERRPLEVLNWLRKLPRKVDSTYAINTTLTNAMTLDRGTPTPGDDLTIQSGQAWVSVTSPTEGTSHLTVFTPDIAGWDRRKQSATIYWIDAQWRFPTPAISPAGSRNTLATLLTRGTDNSPLAGWVVRYEIVGGPQAGFAPDGGTSVEVVTGPNGEAPVEIFQSQPAGGTNQISIQVINPAGPGGPNRRLPVGSGTTVQTWTSTQQSIPYSVPPPPTVPPTQPPAEPPVIQPQTPAPPPARAARLEVTLNGPTTAVLGSDVQFEIAVANRGDAVATNILVSDRFDEGLEHARATGLIERDLVDLQPGDVSRLAVTFHVSSEGPLCQDITVTAAGDVRATARHCITATPSPLAPPPQEPPLSDPQTPLTEPQTPTIEPEPPAEITPTPAAAKVSVTKKGPDRRRVGETALFVIELTNNSETAIEDVQVADNFETSLEPGRATGGYVWLPGNALGWKIDSLAPGRTVRYEIELRCLRPTPRACNRVTVSAPGMEPVADEACLEIATEGAPVAPVAEPGTEISVSLAETADPIKIDGQTTYQVVLTNETEQSAFDVEVAVKFSKELELVGINGPVQGTVSAGTVRFTPIRELRSGENPSFELRFKGIRAGTAQVHVDVTSQEPTKPASAEQTTEVLR